jgi:hypothetical protein
MSILSGNSKGSILSGWNRSRIVTTSKQGYPRDLGGLGRRDGAMPYGWLADNTRWQRRPRTHRSVEEALKETARLYRKDLWHDADAYVEIWLEKDALSGVVWPVTSQFDVPLMVARGYASLSFLHTAAAAISELNVPAHIYHLGDFDPSGVNAGENIERSLREMAPDAEIHFERLQAKIQLRYSMAYFERIPMLAGLVTRESADGLELSTGAELTILANNFRSVRGRSLACTILGECAFWRDDASAAPADELYVAIVPGGATIPGSMIVGISSPHRRDGLLYEKWKDHFGKPDDEVLVIQAPSRALNPSLPAKIVETRSPAIPRRPDRSGSRSGAMTLRHTCRES